MTSAWLSPSPPRAMPSWSNCWGSGSGGPPPMGMLGRIWPGRLRDGNPPNGEGAAGRCPSSRLGVLGREVRLSVWAGWGQAGICGEWWPGSADGQDRRCLVPRPWLGSEGPNATPGDVCSAREADATRLPVARWLLEGSSTDLACAHMWPLSAPRAGAAVLLPSILATITSAQPR